jgi:SnoaL-like domain
MPWLQEVELGRSRRVARVGFFDGISRRDADELLASFAARPLIDDPRHGRVEGEEAFRAYVAAMREWLADERGIEPIGITSTEERIVEEVSVKLPGEHPELPVATATELAADGRIEAIRVYHSLWPLTGGHEIRSPLLEEDPTISLRGSPADYQRGLAAGDARAVVASFEPDGMVREPAGGPFTYRGEAHHAIYDAMFANQGGIPLRFCTVTDDGTRCAIEYNCVRWGKDEIPAQAGLAVYERGPSGRLAAARIYDDVTPPAVSDSTEGLAR